MAALIKTGSFTLLSPMATDWGGAPSPEDYTDTGIRVGGSITSPTGSPTGDGVAYTYDLILDPVEVGDDMHIRDDDTGIVYEVLDVVQRIALIPSTRVRLARVIASS